jgi:hypothetical protein
MNKLIMDTLKSLNIPVSFQKYTGSATQYITFFLYGEQGEAWADNLEKETGYYVQVDVWSKSDYTSLVASVTSAMTSAGFKRTYAADMYEQDTQVYHKAIRFNYFKEV